MLNLVYSHSEYFDVLEIFLEQWDSLFNQNIIICADKHYKERKTIIYDDKLSYSEKLFFCINSINSETIFFHHEDMFLYSTPNISLLNKYEEILLNSPKDFVRLTKAPGHCAFASSNLHENLFNIPEDCEYIFSVQPSIWKTRSMKKFLSSAEKLNLWQLEENSPTINKSVNLSGLCHFNKEPKRGNHYDSSVWPYIASATIKGKWNFSEYEIELNKIKKISKNKRNKI